jgi:hypothetical protein
MNKKTLTSLLTFTVLAIPFLASAVTVDPSLGSTLSLGTADLESTVITIIQWVLGFLGLIAVIMIIWGVVGALTAGGNEDKFAFAKKTIIAAIVGLVVILIAWAIVTFVVKTTATVTQ